MIKRKALIIYILLLMIGALVNIYGRQTNAGANEAVVIPDEAIRLRILANSDSAQDQKLKRKVRDAVNEEINKWVADLTSFAEAKEVIRSRLDEIEHIVANVLKEENSSQTYKVEFGKVNFPTKLYGNYIYPAGQYEAILITLGEGQGANWWCVLFPPLCFLDFSNSEAVREQNEQSKQEVEKESLNVSEQSEETNEEMEPPKASGPSNLTVQQPEFIVEEKVEKIEVKFFVSELLKSIMP
ncbi:stage II sporulation protein R [Bacillus alveayuensis]|jgi:stage II sporulation protein R|uniref:stage II sporulation protein R n=1 Tax=Aeribacillus alveayuensis TaxID=279215 RepID=UPI0005CD99ED|nr:stage II sporulation protein R [Bacillus alveayuensis]